MMRKLHTVSVNYSSKRWELAIYLVVCLFLVFPASVRAEEAAELPVPHTVGNRNAKPHVTADCKEADLEKVNKYGINVLGRPESSKNSIVYFIEEYQTCPQLSCTLVKVYYDAKSDTKPEYSKKEIEQAILEYGSPCMERYLNTMGPATLQIVKEIYNGQLAKKNQADKEEEDRRLQEAAKAEEDAKVAKSKILKGIRVYHQKIGVGIVFGGLAILAGSIAVGVLSEKHSIVESQGCTSPLGVQNDPCVYDLRGAYIPGIVLGGGAVATGLTIAILNR